MYIFDSENLNILFSVLLYFLNSSWAASNCQVWNRDIATCKLTHFSPAYCWKQPSVIMMYASNQAGQSQNGYWSHGPLKEQSFFSFNMENIILLISCSILGIYFDRFTFRLICIIISQHNNSETKKLNQVRGVLRDNQKVTYIVISCRTKACRAKKSCHVVEHIWH